MWKFNATVAVFCFCALLSAIGEHNSRAEFALAVAVAFNFALALWSYHKG